MATRKSSNTALSVVVGLALLYFVYRFILPMLRGGSSSAPRYANAGGGSSSLPFNPFSSKPSASGGGLSAGGNFQPHPDVNAPNPNAFKWWVNQSASDLRSALTGTGSVSTYDSAALDSISIPTIPLETLDLLPTTDVLDPNILTASDYSSLVGDSGPNADGSYYVDPNSYSSSLDSYQIDSVPFETLDLSGIGGADLGLGGGYDPGSLDTGYDPSADNVQIS